MQENAALRTFRFMKLDVYAVAKELAVKVQHAPIRDAELRDQATRAAKSAFLNLSEGLPSDSAVMRKKFFASAAGSCAEVAAALDLGATLGAAPTALASDIVALAFRLKCMLRALK